VRKVAASLLLLLLLLVRALVPALPVYVCLGMGGAHLARPCCDRDDEQPARRALPAYTSRCCRPEAPPTVEPPRPPPAAPQLVLVPDGAVAAVTLVPPVPEQGPVLRLSWRSRPPPIGPPPPLRQILRI
jgi:hypothetical protein